MEMATGILIIENYKKNSLSITTKQVLLSNYFYLNLSSDHLSTIPGEALAAGV